jgi:Tfp pilus assembly pilus retraction ATPase PilT
MAVELNKLLQLVVDKNASDLHLTCGLSPTLRLHAPAPQPASAHPTTRSRS